MAIGTWFIRLYNRKLLYSVVTGSCGYYVGFTQLMALFLTAGVNCSLLCRLCILLCLLVCGDIHPNPGPPQSADRNNIKSKSLSVCHLNAQSLYVSSNINPTHKIDEIYSVLCLENKFDAVCVSETWLDSSIDDSKLLFPGYNIFRRDRNRHGGGTAIYISENITCRRLQNIEPLDIELILLEATFSNQNVIIGACYRQPGQLVADQNIFFRFI